jgi:hypothetical protein
MSVSRDWTYKEQHNLIKWRILKNTYLRLSSFIYWGSICAREKFSLANEEYADNKFVDEANYRVSNSKFQQNSCHNLGNAIYKQNQASEAKLRRRIKNTKSRPQNIKRIII